LGQKNEEKVKQWGEKRSVYRKETRGKNVKAQPDRGEKKRDPTTSTKKLHLVNVLGKGAKLPQSISREEEKRPWTQKLKTKKTQARSGRTELACRRGTCRGLGECKGK